ncbi:hypothetical protein [Rubripirellula tenax]|uniref:hypothetical protein n=1 Tax=Rubripirellula tenax TaxID=2528015 RepID=UPI0011B5A69C|nr:hypothetical protein [Rubripirellula tenax]
MLANLSPPPGYGYRYPTDALEMNQNPYSPSSVDGQSLHAAESTRHHRFTVTLLAVLSALAAWRIIPMFIGFLPASIAISYWLCVFAPVCYFLAMSIFVVCVEYRPIPQFFHRLPVLLLPSVPLSLILMFRMFQHFTSSFFGDITLIVIYNVCVLVGLSLLFPFYAFLAFRRSRSLARV